jgi:hypothetical protein
MVHMNQMMLAIAAIITAAALTGIFSTVMEIAAKPTQIKI